MERCGKWGLGRLVLSNHWNIVIVRPSENSLLMHTLYHPAQFRALAAGETNDARVAQTDIRPLVRIIDRANGNVTWDDYRDDAESRLTELVAAKIASAQRPSPPSSSGWGDVRNQNHPFLHTSSPPRGSSPRGDVSDFSAPVVYSPTVPTNAPY
jgi:non-homologous end joining protein Ku